MMQMKPNCAIVEACLISRMLTRQEQEQMLTLPMKYRCHLRCATYDEKRYSCSKNRDSQGTRFY